MFPPRSAASIPKVGMALRAVPQISCFRAVESVNQWKSNQAGRRVFDHEVPPWVDPDASDYFVTICCKQRGSNQLCLPEVGPALLKSARFYLANGKWFPFVFLLMPDHLHMVVAFGFQHRVEAVVEAWKRYVATKYKVVWQRGFFEHRLRGDESVQVKAAYIRQNPVRAGLVQKEGEWPFFFMAVG